MSKPFEVRVREFVLTTGEGDVQRYQREMFMMKFKQESKRLEKLFLEGTGTAADIKGEVR